MKKKLVISCATLTTMLMLLTFLAVGTLAPAPAGAHPPQEMKIAYNWTDQSVEVTITHSTPSPRFHYINKVEIRKNKGKETTYKYETQPDKTEFTYSYKLPASGGDIIEVKVFCNIYGNMTKNVKITPAAK